jgi:UDPglucose--hexose-1-phosphate uridylyltransferase
VFGADQGLEGHQEIFVEGETRGAFVDFSVLRISRVLAAYAERLRELRRSKGLRGIVIFKNEGPAAGASQTHAHSQLFGLSFIPDRWKEIDARRKKAEKTHGKAAHTIALAEALPSNIIFQDAHVVAFAPQSARFPYEVRILTKRNIDNVTQANEAEVHSLAKALYALLPFVRAHKFSYNFFFHDVFADTHEQFEMRFVPRANVWGGFELDAGVAINPVPAEVAAQEYRLTRPKK